MTNASDQRPNVFRRLITPPAYADEDQARAARILHLILLTLGVVIVVATVASLLVGLTSRLLIVAAVTAAVSAAWYLLRAGRVQVAGVVFLSTTWFSILGASYALGGVEAPTPILLSVVIMMAGLILGNRGAIVFTVLTLIALAGLMIGGQLGLVPPPPEAQLDVNKWITLSLSVGIAGALLYIANASIQAALHTARRNAAALQATNRELLEIHASLETHVAERTNQLNVSTEVARAISSVLDPQELISQVVRLIVERFRFYYAAIFLIDEEGQFAVLVDATGAAGRILKERGHKLEINSPSMVGTAIATRRPRLAQDVDKETMRYANPLLTETRSEVALPLLVGDQALGALDVQATQAYAFDEGTVTVLQGLASQIAIALNNARQYQQAQLEARQATALLEASRLAGFLSEDLAAVATKLLQAISVEAGFDSWLAVLYDAASSTMNMLVAHNANSPIQSLPSENISIAGRADSPLATALRSGRSVVISNPENDPRLAHLPPAVRSKMHLICAPARLGDRVLGAISFVRDSGSLKITVREVQLAEAVAAQLAVAIENHRLLEQSQKSIEEMDRLMRLYTREGWTNLAKGRGAVEFRQEYQRPDAPPLKPDLVSQLDAAITAGEETTGKTIGVDGQTAISVPIALRGEVLGSLSIQDEADREWTSDELATLQAVADQVAQSLESARLLQESESSLQETTQLYLASRAITGAQTPHEILQAIVAAVDTPQIDRCALALVDPESPPTDPEIEIAAAWERQNPNAPTVGNRWRAAQAPVIKWQTLEPLVFNNLAADDIDPASRQVLMNVIGAKAIAVIPMSAGGRFVGWLLLEAMLGPYTFTEQEIRRYRTLAGQAAVSLENRRLFQDVEARVNELTILTRIGRRLASTLELDEILNSVVDETLHATRASQASIALYREGEDALEVRVMRGFNPQTESNVLGTLIRAGEGLHGRLLETGEAVLVNEVVQDAGYREVLSSTRAELIVPIKQGSLLLGALNLESPQPNAFSESDVRLIEAMADQMAVAITNARAYEAERQAVERMREVDRLKTQFLANMSHELRTPLNSVIGFSRVMLRGIDGPLTDMQSTDLTSIYNSGQHLLGLINNILDLSKIEAGKMELSIEPVNLVDVAKTVMSTALALVKDKAIRLEADVPQDLPIVMADQTRVRQIILNLVSNAAKFTEKGFIHLRMVPTPKEVLISVTDTGIGIPPDKLEHIFEEFTQVDASTTRRYGGTGLGLAITRSFAEMHKGRIWVESEVGVGSTFTFTLPREQEEPEPTVSLPTDLEARGAGKKLILCVDDDPNVITLYKRYLEKQGYVVIGVTDATKAVEEARRLLPYAITLDVMMPHRDGWQVLADLKKTPEVSHTPILVCSIIQDKNRGFSLGAADYLVKPIMEDELLRALNRVKRNKDLHKVLIVDDEPSALQLLRRILESQPGFQALEASDGARALSVALRDKPELILLDLMMPEVDGFAILDTIKSNPATRNIPVIVVTAKEITADDRERLNGKMVALFNKGMFTADELLENISQALSKMNQEMAREGQKVEVFHPTAS